MQHARPTNKDYYYESITLSSTAPLSPIDILQILNREPVYVLVRCTAGTCTVSFNGGSAIDLTATGTINNKFEKDESVPLAIDTIELLTSGSGTVWIFAV